MKAVILAGGKGTRLSEETGIRPKPMVEIGDRPILWHIMKIYSAHGINDFVICCGHKGYMIKEYFSDYALRNSDVTFDFQERQTIFHQRSMEPWRVTLIETGEDTMTGGRLRRIRNYVKGETFCCTYGDGVSNVDINALVAFHKNQKALVTLTAVQPEGRFGAIALGAKQTMIRDFREKPKGDGAWINGGFFVMEPAALDLVEGDTTVWEQAPMRELAKKGLLAAYKHEGFWHSMDTLRDKYNLERLWQTGNAPWKVWDRPAEA